MADYPTRDGNGDVIIPAGYTPPKTFKVLGVYNARDEVTGDTNENTVYSLLIPGGTLGKNGVLRVTMVTQSDRNGGTPTWRSRLGGVEIGRTNTGSNGIWALREIVNCGDEAVQRSFALATVGGPSASTSGATSTFTIDTSADQTLTLTVQNAAGTAKSYIDYAIIEALHMD